jgi:ABC-type antimicrobial peptide transport system permease subunit
VIRILFAAAVGLFVLSLPIHSTKVGATLRQCAGVCFAAALLPAFLGGLLFPGLHLSFSEHPILMTLGIALAIAAAYGAVVFRRWLRIDPAKKQKRVQEKTPIDRPRRPQDLLDFLIDNQQPPGPQP